MRAFLCVDVTLSLLLLHTLFLYCLPFYLPSLFSSSAWSASQKVLPSSSSGMSAAGGAGSDGSKRVSLSADAVPALAVTSGDPSHPLLQQYEASVGEDDSIDTRLLVAILEYICVKLPSVPAPSGAHKHDISGAILVFLPGWDEISRVREDLARHPVG